MTVKSKVSHGKRKNTSYKPGPQQTHVDHVDPVLVIRTWPTPTNCVSGATYLTYVLRILLSSLKKEKRSNE